MDHVDLAAAIFDESVTLEDLKARLRAARSRQQEQNKLLVVSKDFESEEVDTYEPIDPDSDLEKYKSLYPEFFGNGDVLEDDSIDASLGKASTDDSKSLINLDDLQDTLDELADLQRMTAQQQVHLGSIHEELVRLRMRHRARQSTSANHSAAPREQGGHEEGSGQMTDADLERLAAEDVQRMIEEAEANLDSEQDDELHGEEDDGPLLEDQEGGAKAEAETLHGKQSRIGSTALVSTKSKRRDPAFEDADDDDEVEEMRYNEAKRVIQERLEHASKYLGDYLDIDDEDDDNTEEDDDDDGADEEESHSREIGKGTGTTTFKPADTRATTTGVRGGMSSRTLATHGGTGPTGQSFSLSSNPKAQLQPLARSQSGSSSVRPKRLDPIQQHDIKLPIGSVRQQQRRPSTTSKEAATRPSSSKAQSLAPPLASIVAPITPKDIVSARREPVELTISPNAQLTPLSELKSSTSSSLRPTTGETTSSDRLPHNVRAVKAVRALTGKEAASTGEMFVNEIPQQELKQAARAAPSAPIQLERTNTQRLRVISVPELEIDDDHADTTNSDETKQQDTSATKPQSEPRIPSALDAEVSASHSFSYKEFLNLKSQGLRLGVSRAVPRPVPGKR